MNNVGYRSSNEYLALPDILKTTFRHDADVFTVYRAPAPTFHRWLESLCEWEFEDVDTSKWYVHHRWRIINELLKDHALSLVEVPEGYQLCLPPEPEPEEKASISEEKSSEIQHLPEPVTSGRYHKAEVDITGQLLPPGVL